jgi:hypothetical protein
MSLYQRGNVWYYLFYLNGKRYRGSTKTENEKEAGRIYAKAMVAAEAGESTKPKRAPLVQSSCVERQIPQLRRALHSPEEGKGLPDTISETKCRYACCCASRWWDRAWHLRDS